MKHSAPDPTRIDEAQGGYKIPALRALSEITTSLASESDLEDLLARFLGTMIRLAGAKAGAVRVVTSDGSHLRLVGARGLPPEVVEQERLVDLQCGVCGEATRDNALRDSTELDVCFARTSLDYFGNTCKRVIAVPMQYKGKVMGIYNLFLEADRNIPEEVSLLFRSISEHLGMALENARLTRENLRITLMDERQMLANEMHDSLAQTMAYMKMRLALLQESVEDGDCHRSLNYLNEVNEALELAYSNLRELLGQFRNRMDPRGLMPALQDLAAKFRERTGIALELINRVPDLDLTPDQEVQVFHIVQEALANTYKHAAAQQVVVSIELQDDRYRVAIADNGIGMSASEQTPLHFGLAIMRERAQRLGGSITHEGRPGEGTRMELDFPVTPAKRARP